MKKTILLASISLAASCAMAEDVTNAFINCAITKEDKKRLACYDKIRDDIVRANQPQNPSPYPEILIEDLKTDLKLMRGRKISVKAYVQTMGEILMLKSDTLDMSPVTADMEKLPREDRKKLLNGCQVVLCKGTFYGTVKNLSMGLGLQIEKVTW